MIMSMTGYGRGDARSGGWHFQVELKTVNNRYLEAFLKLPSGLWDKEAEARALVTGALSRGKVEMTWRELADKGAKEAQVFVDESLAKSYAKAFQALAKSLGLKEKPRLEWVARQNGVLKEADSSTEDPKRTYARWQCFKKALTQAVASLKASRVREGKTLEKELEKWLDSSLQLVSSIETASKEMVRQFKDRLTARLAELLESMPPDDPRLAMEAAMLAEKTDIREELVRFRSHVGEFKRLLKLKEPSGKRLDFLCQEMLREANTMGSKTPEASVAHLVVEIKGQIEKIKEQALNVE